MTVHDSCTLDSLVEAYKQYQRRVRGLRERTLQGYEQILRPFLRFSLGEDPLDLTHLRPSDVVQFITSMRERFSARSMKAVRTALRSLFRFLRVTGTSKFVVFWRFENRGTGRTGRVLAVRCGYGDGSSCQPLRWTRRVAAVHSGPRRWTASAIVPQARCTRS